MNCKECKYWSNHETIQDVSNYELRVPVEWKLCNNEMYKSSINMFPKDEKYGEFVSDNVTEYFGIDRDGKFRKFPEYLYHTSELFGCVFFEILNKEKDES